MDANSLHRLTKVLIDSGEAETLTEAQETFENYGVRIVIGHDVINDQTKQVIALTAINTAARSFQGNVQVIAPHDMNLVVPGFTSSNLESFLDWLVLKEVDEHITQTWPCIIIGRENKTEISDKTIRPWADGWNFGIGKESSTNFFAPSCVAAGGLAVSEAFSILRRDNPYSGLRSITMSLWSVLPGEAINAPLKTQEIPNAWIVGLGHLGQAYAWTLGFMTPAKGTTLYLQDVDIITKSTLSTSILSTTNDIEKKKSRVVAEWLEARGYNTAIIERRFDEFQHVGVNEPNFAMFGVDNAAARRVLEKAGFQLVIDAGLGAGYQDFRAIRMRTFPGPSSAAALWAASDNIGKNNINAAAYKNLLAEGAEPCGVTTLATRAVGAPFVGCVAAAYVVAELVRSQIDGPSYGYIDLNLRDPERLEAC
jgi:hypothetical protein